MQLSARQFSTKKHRISEKVKNYFCTEVSKGLDFLFKCYLKTYANTL